MTDIDATEFDTTVIVPTFNESANVDELVLQLSHALYGRKAEILFVDDSTDNTPEVITHAAATSSLPVRLLHRDKPVGGLSGAVVEGLNASTSDWVVVMDGDLQHPPELVPTLLDTGMDESADIVIASRHVAGGSAAGLDGPIRQFASNASKALAIAMFPVRLRDCSDPMTGFFALRRDKIDIDELHPHGFKILLEILARNQLRIAEVPLSFRERTAGESKASVSQGIQYLQQLTYLRFGKLSMFAIVGAVGAVANLVIMALLLGTSMWYVYAALIAGLCTTLGNFVLQEKFVFADLKADSYPLRQRFIRSFSFNASETLVRSTLLWALVEATGVHSILMQAILIAISFVLRFAYQALVVYKPRA